MQLTPTVHLVGSGLLGLNLSDDYDCNAYLVDCGSEWILVDSGAGYRTQSLLEEINQSGGPVSQITRILLTHEHADHSGGVSTLRELTGATVYATAATAAAVEDVERFIRYLDGARRSGSYPVDYLFQGFEVDEILTPGESLQVGDTHVDVIATPGHCEGHCSFVIKRDQRVHLFAGDALLPGGQIVLQAIDDCSVSDSVMSIEALEPTKPDLLLAGHLAPVLRDGHRHIEFALSRVRRGLLPHQLVLPERNEAH
jgi:glyoxylase-like metal-dependent hydrolase (beta-lactamase superfamily II)